MTHEFSHNPIKLRIVDIKTGEWKKSYVFIGEVPTKVKQHLSKLEREYNKNKQLSTSAVLKKFYGRDWKCRLGVDKTCDSKSHNSNGKSGGSNSKSGGSNSHEEEFQELFASMIVGLPDNHATGGADTNADSETNSTGNSTANSTADSKTKDGESGEPVSYVIDEQALAEFDLGDEILDEDNSKAAEIEVTEEEMAEAATEELAVQVTVTNDVFKDGVSTESIESTGRIEFVFNIKVYPSDSILTLKHKIYLHANIPIYRQHLWFKYKNKSYPAQYALTMFKNATNIDIERLIGFYSGNEKMDEIEGIPVNLDYYKNKDFMQVAAYDTFNLMYTNYNKYGVTEYFVADINDLLNPTVIYNKLKRDRYQLEVIYYGFVVIYFPMMTFVVFMDYLKNEKSIADIYGELRYDKAYLRKRFNLASTLIDESYEAQIDSKQLRKNLFSSITHTIISIDNYKQDISSLLVLRNIFDLLKLTASMTYCKAHLLHENQRIMLKKSYFNEAEPRESIPINSLLIKIKTNPDTNEFMKLIIFKNGNYIVKTNWREENHMDFTKITREVAKRINPIIKTVNAMGNKVKHYNVTIPELSKDNIQFTETNFVFYYEDNVTEARFKVFKNILHDFAAANFLIQKENVVLGEEYFFREGMYKFDAARIEKAIALSNYYDYLSNGIVKQKWSTIFERTQLFTVISVASKIKISISGIRNDTEIHFFYLYLIGMLHIYMRNAANVKRIAGETVQNKSKRRLKNLKLQDPLLYDFKKIYNSNVIYSKICQKPYQPIILNDKEYKNMSKEKRARAVKYWNFTKEKQVWYSCPNPKYPYIKFIIKQHPKDYCIPCCKKIEMNKNVNKAKQRIHETCLKLHLFSGEKVSLTKGSHYIATYGKNIEVGRLSRLPEHTLEPLFFDTYSPEGGIDAECITADGYYLFGVDQNTNNIDHIGYLYCLVHALNMSVDDFLVDCVKKLKSAPEKFRVLLDGNANLYFGDNRELIDKLVILNDDTFLENRYENVPWNDLLMSIGYYFYGVNTIKFSDRQRETIDMILPKGLKTADEMFPATHKNLVVLNKGSNYYPVYLLNTNVFKRTGIIDTRLFLNESGLITTVQAVVRRHFEGVGHEKIRTRIDLTIIKDFSNKHPRVNITGYYINYANLCYAVNIEYMNKQCYMPIYASHYPLDKSVDMIFAPFSDSNTNNIKTLQQLYSMYNKWVDYESEKADLGKVNIYPKITIDKWLSVLKSKDVIGFVCNGMNYYISQISKTSALSHRKAPIQYVLYNPIKINKMIFNVKIGKNKNVYNPAINTKLQLSTYHYYMYELIILQFISIFNRQQNKPMRKKLLNTLAKTNFNKDMANIRTFITDLDDVEDKQKVKNIISRFINEHHNKRRLVTDINSSFFNFDKVKLEKLKLMEYKLVVKELQKMAKAFVKIGKINFKTFEFPNILVPCGQVTKKDNADYCSGNKFIMSREQLNNILDIIAYDITNPSKWKSIFNAAFIEKSVDFFKFIRRGPETIKVSFL